MMRAPVWRSLVKIPDCDPVNEMASTPRASSAIANSAIEMRSPVESSMSNSRRGGDGVTERASANSSSVVLPIAETTTTTRRPLPTVSATRSATFPSRAASATELPPNFWTTIGLSMSVIRSLKDYTTRARLHRCVASSSSSSSAVAPPLRRAQRPKRAAALRRGRTSPRRRITPPTAPNTTRWSRARPIAIRVAGRWRLICSTAWAARSTVATSTTATTI